MNINCVRTEMGQRIAANSIVNRVTEGESERVRMIFLFHDEFIYPLPMLAVWHKQIESFLGFVCCLPGFFNVFLGGTSRINVQNIVDVR